MKQYLLSKEVYKKLVAKTNPEASKVKDAAQHLIKYITYYDIVDGGDYSLVSQLEGCANYLRSKNIFVFFKVEKDHCGDFHVTFVAGEAGRVIERLDNQYTYISDLDCFVGKNEDILPKSLVRKAEMLIVFLYKIRDMINDYLIPSYIGDDKERLKEACKRAWKLAKEIDKYLERNIDLCRVYAMVTAL
jgi:hypothetical protein